jgi:hypothetical protein
MNELAPSITRWSRPTFAAGASSGSSSAAGAARTSTFCFSPVHSRKLPQVPQNVSLSVLR